MSKRIASSTADGEGVASPSKKQSPIEKHFPAVVLSTSGHVNACTLPELSPLMQAESALLGHKCSISGVYTDYDMGLIVREDQTNQALAINPHKLQPPFHKQTIRGDILVFRIDQEGHRVPLTVDEYLTFQSIEIPEWTLDDEDADLNDDFFTVDELDIEPATGDTVATSSALHVLLAIAGETRVDCEDLFERDLTSIEAALIDESVGFIYRVYVKEAQKSDDEEPEEVDASAMAAALRSEFEAMVARELTETELVVMTEIISRSVEFLNGLGDDEDEDDAEEISGMGASLRYGSSSSSSSAAVVSSSSAAKTIVPSSSSAPVVIVIDEDSNSGDHVAVHHPQSTHTGTLIAVTEGVIEIDQDDNDDNDNTN